MPVGLHQLEAVIHLSALQWPEMYPATNHNKRLRQCLDIQGIEPWTSRMRSVRATTVPNARNVIDVFDGTWRLGSAAAHGRDLILEATRDSSAS